MASTISQPETTHPASTTCRAAVARRHEDVELGPGVPIVFEP